MTTRIFPALAALLVLAGPAPATAQTLASSEQIERLDEIFRDFDSAASPGCAVATARNGTTLVERAWGMADLEHGIANHAGTIFEAGSVSKQFAAAAIVLLAMDGALSLDDDVRDYVPEVPDYGTPITIHQMMTHTSGLRDWGSVASISGWGRGARTHDHDHVVDLLSRQSALNFEPGDQYSYSNSGYNLMAVIVDRVSGMSFAEFSRTRIFEPLGMHDTQWRADYRTIVPGRSSAYSPRGRGFAINIPIEHVHGNGGLLTTVADLLTWNEHLRTGTPWGPQFMDMMHRRGVLNDGETIHYAGGLQFGTRRGHPQITHTGATSGYRAYLGLFPEEGLSVALLCNVTSANPGGLGGSVADVFLPAGEEQADAATGTVEDPASIDVLDGTGEWIAQEGAGAGIPSSRTMVDVSDPEAYVGSYHSDDAEVTLRVTLEEGRLVLHRRPATRMTLNPQDEADTFQASLGTIRFIRGPDGTVNEFSVSQARVFDLRFHRVDD